MFFLFLRFTVGFVRPTVSFLRQSMVAFALFSHLIFGVSSVPADEGPMLEVTADTAPIQVTKNGTPQTLGTVTKGTRLWPFETMGEHYLVLVPGTQTKGWIHDRLAGPIVLSDRDQQRLEEAESTFSEATAAFDEGRFAEALKSSEAALKEFVRLFGELHTLTGNALNQTGLCHMNLEDYEAAEPLLQRALKVRLTLYGEADEFTGYSIANLADMYERNGEDQKSAEKYRQLLKIRERELGADHETTIEVVESLGHVLAVPGSYPEADRLLRRALRVRERLNPEDNEQTAWVLHNLGYVCDESGKNSEALNHIQRSFDIRTRLLGESHEDTTLTLNNLASLHLELSDYDKAKAAYEQLRCHLHQTAR
ncbi:MAG: tetratricopeptide repeat protein [Planctomycetaceae bacterium]